MFKFLLPFGSLPEKGSNFTTGAQGNQVDKLSKTFKIYRYSGIGRPKIDTFTIQITSKIKTVMDALTEVTKKFDSSLAFRSGCCEGTCGTCSINVNKMNVLACTTKLSSLPKNVNIFPVSGSRVIKDLVWDDENLFEGSKKMQPWSLEDLKQKNNKERFQTKKQVDLICEADKCIMCGCCSTRCPSYWWQENKFAGPAALMQAFRWIFDSRESNLNRTIKLNLIKEKSGINLCHSIFSCTTTCPKKLNPANTISKLKRATFLFK